MSAHTVLSRAAGRLRLGALVLVVAAAVPVAAAAQSVTGRVLEAGTRRPIGRVAVTLVDSAGRPAARAETSADGVFYVDAPSPGSYMLDFAPADGSPPLRTPARVLAAGQEVQVEFVLAPATPPPPALAPPALAPPALASPGPAAALLGEWYDPQPRGWPALRLRLQRQEGDSVFGELMVSEETEPFTVLVRGRFSQPRLELRGAIPGGQDFIITGEFHGQLITAERRDIVRAGWTFPRIAFRRQK